MSDFLKFRKMLIELLESDKEIFIDYKEYDKIYTSRISYKCSLFSITFNINNIDIKVNIKYKVMKDGEHYVSFHRLQNPDITVKIYRNNIFISQEENIKHKYIHNGFIDDRYIDHKYLYKLYTERKTINNILYKKLIKDI